jgi:hypothetical protein
MEIRRPTIAVSVHHKYKVIFLHIPKNAGTAIKSTFFPRHSFRLDVHRSWEQTDEGYQMFTVWRMDVVDRFMTAYLEDVKRVDKDCHWMKDMKWYIVSRPKQRLLTYLSEAEEYDGFSHCIKQTDAAADHKGNLYDFGHNFTMNTIQKASDVLFDGRKVPQKQSNTYAKGRISPLFTKDVIDRVKKLYQDDIDHISNLVTKGKIWER